MAGREPEQTVPLELRLVAAQDHYLHAQLLAAWITDYFDLEESLTVGSIAQKEFAHAACCSNWPVRTGVQVALGGLDLGVAEAVHDGFRSVPASNLEAWVWRRSCQRTGKSRSVAVTAGSQARVRRCCGRWGCRHRSTTARGFMSARRTGPGIARARLVAEDRGIEIYYIGPEPDLPGLVARWRRRWLSGVCRTAARR